MRKFFLRRSAVGAAKKFLKGYKCLTERGVGRIDKVIEKLSRYGEEVKKCGKTGLGEMVEFDMFVYEVCRGLMEFKKGTLGGFVEFEESRCLERLAEFVERKGRV